MKSSTPESPKPAEPKSILLIGPPGGGKTTLMLQFPKVEVKDCDRNLDGPERFLRTKLKTLSYLYDQITYNEKGPVDLGECYDRLVDSLAAARTTDSLTVGVDSLTLVNEFIIRKTLGKQARTEIAIRDWISIKSYFAELLVAKLRGVGKTIIVTVHEDPVTETDPKNVMNKIIVAYDPSIQGSTAHSLGGLFTDVWRCESKPSPGDKIEYSIQTTATSKSRYLKNTMGMPSSITVKDGELMFDKIKPYLEGRV